MRVNDRALELWRDYAATWSAPETERPRRLLRQVVEEVAYRDPNSEVKGREALARYMGDFQASFPGHRFEIVDISFHHDRSLARWHLVDATGAAVLKGASLGCHDPSGRLVDIAGFFPQ